MSPAASPEAVRLDLRLTAPALAAWVVAWQARTLPVPVVLGVAALAALAGVALLAGHRVLLAAVLLCAAAAAVATAGRVGARTTEPLSTWARERTAVTVTAQVLDDPRTTRARGRDLVVVEVALLQVRARGRTVALRAPAVVLTSAPGWTPLLPGQQLRTRGRLGPAERGADVAAVLTGVQAPELLGTPGRVQRAAGHLRAGLREAVAPLPAAERGLLPGLVVGDVSRLDPELREDFRALGLTHLVAVSGTNVAVLLGAVLLLCRGTGVPLRARPLLGAVVLVGFVVLARPSPSVLRAAVMGAVGLLALATGERRRTVPALSAAVLVLVLADPDLAAAPGFALSVLATGGLLLLAPSWGERLARVFAGGREPGRWAQAGGAALAVPAAAQVACAPVVVALSGNLGLLSVPANLLAVPAVAPATVLGVVAALLAPLSLPAAQGLAWVAWLPTAWLVRVAQTGAGLPGAQVLVPTGWTGTGLVVLLTVLLGLLLARRALRRVTAAAVAGALVAGVALAAARPSWPPTGWVAVACDVGQGDATVLRAGPGVAVVVDAGPDPGLVDRCLDRLGVEQVPVVLLTHLHADHVDGLAGVLRDRAVGVVEVGPLADPPEQWQDVQADTRRGGVTLVPALVGQVRTVGAVRWEVLAPSRAYRGTRSDPNNSSLVLRVETAGVALLLTGDVEPEAQRDLLRLGPALRADVLKVPHHGSRHQDPRFLAAVGARLALTSVGVDNGYGHPAPETVAVLEQAGARHLRTDTGGDLAVVVRGGVLSVVPRGP